MAIAGEVEQSSCFRNLEIAHLHLRAGRTAPAGTGCKCHFVRNDNWGVVGHGARSACRQCEHVSRRFRYNGLVCGLAKSCFLGVAQVNHTPPQPYTPVLVAILSQPCDLETARQQHWYRIPVKRLPERAANLPILAFFQTKAFGDEKWSINYYAHATSWDIVRRIELLPREADHPRADEPYYRVSLDELQRLPHPIVSRKWRRVTFLVTHWQRLQTAHEINELLHGTIWEEHLWKALRKMGRLAEKDDWDDW